MATIMNVLPEMHDSTIPMETYPEAIRRTDSLGSVPLSVWCVWCALRNRLGEDASHTEGCLDRLPWQQSKGLKNLSFVQNSKVSAVQVIMCMAVYRNSCPHFRDSEYLGSKVCIQKVYIQKVRNNFAVLILHIPLHRLPGSYKSLWQGNGN